MENEFLTSLLPTWYSLSSAMDIHAGPASADQSPDCFFSPFWEKSTESSGGFMFDSSLSSLASSPVSPPNISNDGFLLRELIGKLGSSGEFSPKSCKSGNLFKENASKLGHSTSPMYPSFAEHSPAVRLSSLGAQSFSGRSGQFAELAAMGKVMSRVSSSPSLRPLGSPMGDPPGSKNPNPALQDGAELSNSRAESTVLNPEKNPGPERGAKPPNEANWRKRKAAPKGQEDDIEGDSGTKRVKQSDGGHGNENGHVKAEEEARGRSDHGKDENLQVKNEVKPPEPPKDYIHVRARRGQATDSHSLAERVRREKISERMKILQDLVPGCNKVIGKAVMLDEIINYVQSLQRQVEFLSMKLASVNNGTRINTNAPMAKDVFQSESTGPQPMLPLDSSSSALYGQKSPAVNLSTGAILQYSVDPLNDAQFLPYQGFLGDDLNSIVQSGFGQN